VESVHAGGCISLLGNPMGNTEIPLKIHSMMLRKEVEINGVWNSSRAPYPVDEWEYTVRMMDEGKFEAADLITDRPSHEELPAILKELKDGTRKSIKVMCI